MPNSKRRGTLDAQWQRTPFHPYIFAPDLDPATPGAISDAAGFYPTARGLRTIPTLRLLIQNSYGAFNGWFSAVFPGGSSYVYAGTSTHLYASSGPVFVENDNGQTFTGGNNPWTFALVGSTVIATNGQDAVQAVTAAGGQFSALGGSPPVAHIASSADPGGTGYFAFLFNLQSNSQAWACSGAGNPASWPLDTTNLSATGILGVTPGPVTAATPLRNGIVAFKATSFYYGTFIGTPYVWSFQPISLSQGVAGPYAYANAGDAVYFIGNDNIYSFDGYSIYPVPNSLAEWLIKRTLDANHASNIVGSYDAANDIVKFFFPSTSANPLGTLDTAIMWNRRSGHWCVDHQTVGGALQFNLPITQATTYAQMTTTYPIYGAIVPGTTYAILAPTASATTASATFDTAGNLYIANGIPRQLNTYIITDDIGRPERQTSIFRSRLNWSIFPFNGIMSVQGLGKDLEGQTAQPISEVTVMGPRGFFDLRQTARWNNLKYFVTGDCEITGYEVLVADGGGR